MDIIRRIPKRNDPIDLLVAPDKMSLVYKAGHGGKRILTLRQSEFDVILNNDDYKKLKSLIIALERTA